MEKTPIQKAENNIGYGTFMGGVCFLVTLVCSLGHFLGLGYFNLIDTAIYGVGTWKVATKRSVWWMCIMSADWLGGVLMHLSSESTARTSSQVLFAYFWTRGIIGVFQYRSLKKAEAKAGQLPAA